MLLTGLLLGSCATAISGTDLIDRKQLCNALTFVDQYKPSRYDSKDSLMFAVRVKAFFFGPSQGFCIGI
jgi:hypothetical protein